MLSHKTLCNGCSPSHVRRNIAHYTTIKQKEQKMSGIMRDSLRVSGGMWQHHNAVVVYMQ